MHHPKLLADEEIRAAHRKYTDSQRGLRSVAGEYGISHVQLAAGFHRLGLAVKGNRATDPEVIAEVLELRDRQGATWASIAAHTNLSHRQVQNIYAKHKED